MAFIMKGKSVLLWPLLLIFVTKAQPQLCDEDCRTCESLTDCQLSGNTDHENQGCVWFDELEDFKCLRLCECMGATSGICAGFQEDCECDLEDADILACGNGRPGGCTWEAGTCRDNRCSDYNNDKSECEGSIDPQCVFKPDNTTPDPTDGTCIVGSCDNDCSQCSVHECSLSDDVMGNMMGCVSVEFKPSNDAGCISVCSCIGTGSCGDERRCECDLADTPSQITQCGVDGVDQEGGCEWNGVSCELPPCSRFNDDPTRCQQSGALCVFKPDERTDDPSDGICIDKECNDYCSACDELIDCSLSHSGCEWNKKEGDCEEIQTPNPVKAPPIASPPIASPPKTPPVDATTTDQETRINIAEYLEIKQISRSDSSSSSSGSIRGDYNAHLCYYCHDKLEEKINKHGHQFYIMIDTKTNDKYIKYYI